MKMAVLARRTVIFVDRFLHLISEENRVESRLKIIVVTAGTTIQFYRPIISITLLKKLLVIGCSFSPFWLLHPLCN